jgi:hypothetical protein
MFLALEARSVSKRSDKRFLRGVDALGAFEFAAAEGTCGRCLGRGGAGGLAALSFGHRGVFWKDLGRFAADCGADGNFVERESRSGRLALRGRSLQVVLGM